MLSVDSIFFDVDGTLVNSAGDIAKAMNYTLNRLGIAEKPTREIASYIGTGVRDLARKSTGSDDDNIIDEAVRIFSEYYLSHSTDESTLYPHVKEMLEHFKGKRKFILTNRYKRFADVTLKGFGIRDYFEAILGGDDESCMKPSACVIDNFLPKLGIEKGRSLIVGDMAIDIMTGKNSGIKTCWVTYGLGRSEDLLGLSPDFIVDDIMELSRIIK